MSDRRQRLVLSWLISCVPWNAARVFLYRELMGYRIERSHIGWRTEIVVDEAEFTDCHVGSGNKFIGPMRVTVGAGTQIGGANTFSCGWWSTDPEHQHLAYRRSLDIGSKVIITSGHYLDVVGAISIGAETWVAGHASQFWTHGAGVREGTISIGARCYIGSAVCFAPGAAVGDDCIVGLGSVVTRAFSDHRVMIAGQPAKVVKDDFDWKDRLDPH